MTIKRILALTSGIEALTWDDETNLVVLGYWHPDKEFPAWRVVLSFYPRSAGMRWNAWKIMFPGQTHLTGTCPRVGLTLLHANGISMDDVQIRARALRSLPQDGEA